MTFTFNDQIPAANNNPSADQGQMLINNQSTNSIIAVDHVTFNTANSGTHKQVTYIDKFVPAVPSDPTSVAYTDVGKADASHPQNYWKNSQGTFPLSAIRAFGAFGIVGATTPAVTNINGINVTGISAVKVTSIFTYTISLTANSTNGTNFVAIVSPSINNSYLYSLSADTLTIVVNQSLTPFFTINFLILQI